MSWDEFYRRRDALDAVLATGDLDHAAARASVGDRDQVLAALRHRWSLVLTGHLGAALTEDGEATDAVARAWRRAAADRPALRRLLDEHGGPDPAERRLVALAAGLADPHEPAESIEAIGAAFLGLIRNQDQPPRRRRRWLSPTG
jgi:hypothetical protein